MTTSPSTKVNPSTHRKQLMRRGGKEGGSAADDASSDKDAEQSAHTKSAGGKSKSDRKSLNTTAGKMRHFSTDRIRQLYRELPRARSHTSFQFTAKDALLENLQNVTMDFPDAFKSKESLLSQVDGIFSELSNS